MTNGSVAITEGLLQRSGLDEHVCLKLDVAGPQKWKPAKEAYHYAVESLQLQGTPEQAGAFPDGVFACCWCPARGSHLLHPAGICTLLVGRQQAVRVQGLGRRGGSLQSPTS